MLSTISQLPQEPVVTRATAPIAAPQPPVDTVSLNSQPKLLPPAPGQITSGANSPLDENMGAHRGKESKPVEMWIFKGNLESDGTGPKKYFSIGENFWHVRPVIAGHQTIPLLAHHSALTDYQTGEYLAQEQSSLILPWLSKLDTDHFNFKVTYGVGGDVRHPLTFLTRLGQLGQTAKAERTAAGITIDSPIKGGGKVHLDLTPATPPVWWKIQMGLGGQADLLAYPTIHAQGTICKGGETTPVKGDLYCEQILGGQDLKSSYKNLTWFFFDVSQDTRVVVYSFTDKDGNRVTPQVKICHDDGRLEECAGLTVTQQQAWTSPCTGKQYGTKWHLDIPEKHISADVATRMQGQEVPGLMGLKPFYYGGTDVSGTVDGQAFTSQGYSMQQYNDTDVF